MPRKIEDSEVDGWGGKGGAYKTIKAGESAEFEVIDDYIYEVLEGEEDILGNEAQYNTMQTMIIDHEDDKEKVLTIQKGLGKLMKIKLEESGRSFSDLKGTVFQAQRYDERTWEVRVLMHRNGTVSKAKNKTTKDNDDIVDLITNALNKHDNLTKKELVQHVVLKSGGKVKKKEVESTIEALIESEALKEDNGNIVLEE